MNILDFQNFIETRHQSFGRSDLMPSVSITPKAKQGDLKNGFSQTAKTCTEDYPDDSAATIRYTDPKTGERLSKDLQIIKMP
jgi:hypothetical protein